MHDERGRRRIAERCVGVVAAARLQRSEHALARRHAQPGRAKARCERIHAAEADPVLVGTRGHVDGQHGDAARCGDIRRNHRRRARAPHDECDDADHQRDHGSDDPAPHGRLPRAGRERLLHDRQFVVRRRDTRSVRLDDTDARLRHPPIAILRHRADAALVVAVVADRASRTQHDLAELRIGNVDAAPERSDELVAPDRTLAVLDQVHEAVEHARRHRDRRAAPRELAGRTVETVFAELIRRRLDHAMRAEHSRSAGRRSTRPAAPDQRDSASAS